ncbi:hypothetical protein [Stieleria marina]|uniref:hypothetical protein n=1 Tax=Stieleria marina TaxID=1930275 RepID=UPI003AF3685C
MSEFIESLYVKQFGKERPDEVHKMEDIAAAHVEKRAARKAENLLEKNNQAAEEEPASTETVSEETSTSEADIKTEASETDASAAGTEVPESNAAEAAAAVNSSQDQAASE